LAEDGWPCGEEGKRVHFQALQACLVHEQNRLLQLPRQSLGKELQMSAMGNLLEHIEGLRHIGCGSQHFLL